MENRNHPLLKSLNEEQYKAVTHLEGAIMVLAGAGSGKTRVLTHRIAYLILENNIPAYRILAMTFTNKAAKEMKGRIEQLTSMDVRQLWIGTFHSIFARILRNEASAIGYNSNYSIYDTTDQENIIKRIMEARSINIKLISPKKVRAKISSLKNKMITPKLFEENHAKKEPFDNAVREIYWEYGARLLHNNAMDFDDLLNNVIKLFKENPEILEKYQNKFDHILIDEYQDTNVAQFEIIKMLGKKHGNVCVVGDDDQSIYKWRGAEVKNVFKFVDSFPKRTTYKLERNYRSTPQILEVANSLIIHNQSRMDKELWTKNPSGDKPVLLTIQNPRQEAQKIISKIKNLKSSFGFSNNDMAILYRTNAQSRYFEEELIKNNITYLIYGGMRFYERKEIKDMLAYLHILVNNQNSVAFRRIINVPSRKIGDRTVEILFNKAAQEKTDHWEIINNFEKYKSSFRGNPPLKAFGYMVNQWKEKIKELELPQIFDMVLQESGLYNLYYNELINENIDRLENLEQLKTSMAEFQEAHAETATLENYLQTISLISDLDNPQGDFDGIKMMTVHMAKGLEFPAVFVAGLEENLFPHSLSMGDHEEMDEERRLFYVAITRAKERLVLSNCLEREKFYQKQFNFPTRQQPSRFLKEIPAALLEHEQSTAYKPSFSTNHNNDSGYIAGDWVVHNTYGRGKVTEVIGRVPRQQVSVVFDDNTIRTFFTHIAKMEKE